MRVSLYLKTCGFQTFPHKEPRQAAGNKFKLFFKVYPLSRISIACQYEKGFAAIEMLFKQAISLAF